MRRRSLQQPAQRYELSAAGSALRTMGGTGAITGVSCRTWVSAAGAPPRWRAFQRSRASRCSSAASRLLRSTMLFCSAAESFFAWSRQNHRLRGPAPASPQPGTGHRRPARRPSGSRRPEDARATASFTWRCTSSPMAELKSCANRAMRARNEPSLFRWAMIVAFVCAGEVEQGPIYLVPRRSASEICTGPMSASQQAFELVRRILLRLVRLLLRLLLHFLLLLLRDLLSLLLLLIGGTAEDARDQARPGGLHDGFDRAPDVQVGDARARSGSHE